MSSGKHITKLATVSLYHDAETGEYATVVSFDIHGSGQGGFLTPGGALDTAKQLVLAELHSCPTVEVPAVMGTGSKGNG